MDAATITPAEIMAIPATAPEQLYPADINDAKQLYRRLAQRFHPDKDASNKDVFQKVKALYELAIERLSNDAWNYPGITLFHTIDGRKFRLKYLARHDFEMGSMYASKLNVVFAIDNAYSDLYESGLRVLRSHNKVPVEMHNQSKICMPAIVDDIKCTNQRLLILTTPNASINLRDVLNHYGGAIDPAHVAWMVSRMCNIRCLLHYGLNVAHGDLSPDTLFISPAEHTACLFGGWWYSTVLGEPIQALPPRTLAVAGASLVASQGQKPLAGRVLTGELVRATGRELLGDLHGSRLLLNKAIPPPMLHWLRTPTTQGPFEDYKEWVEQVLPAAFGKRKFVVMPLTTEQVYGA